MNNPLIPSDFESRSTCGEPLIVLASASPRRRELLAQIGIPFLPVVVDVDEWPAADETPGDYVQRVAADKSQAGRERCGDRLPILGADTEVVCDGAVFGKPRDCEHARAMLKRLSGRTHKVLSAVSLRHRSRHWVAVCESMVTLRALTDDEIAAYWASGEPRGKAGAYAIQGLGGLFIQRLEGSFSGVMGLPLFETGRLLSQVGIEPRALLYGGALNR